ncbi:unnamed protein product [Orchesella dallaii]|uniref:CRAL-TRIO domain-containing protein n=1 Tax=Orchesella dallaii TaxID=48710 RepID=A0ABP1R1C1_9HEXA
METLRMENSELAIFSKVEEEGLVEMKKHIEDYLIGEKLKKDSCPKVSQFLEKAKLDNQLLLDYVQARKNNVDCAWDTLKMYAENRFKHYPEVFPNEVPRDLIHDLVGRQLLGVLKNRDKFGRRIVFFDMTKWDINHISLDDLTMAGTIAADIFWRDPEVLEGGIVVVENTIGFGLGHAKQHTMGRMLRMRNVFVQSFPISLQGIFYLQMPYLFTLVFKMSKHLFPKKVRSRMFCYSSNQEPTELYDIAPPEILPEWMGGKLSIEEAAEGQEFYEKFFT